MTLELPIREHLFIASGRNSWNKLLDDIEDMIAKMWANQDVDNDFLDEAANVCAATRESIIVVYGYNG